MRFLFCDVRTQKPHKSMINACHLKHYNDPGGQNDIDLPNEDDLVQNDVDPTVDQQQNVNFNVDQQQNVDLNVDQPQNVDPNVDQPHNVDPKVDQQQIDRPVGQHKQNVVENQPAHQIQVNGQNGQIQKKDVKRYEFKSAPFAKYKCGQ